MRDVVPAKVLARDKWFLETSVLIRETFTDLKFISHGACCYIKGSLVDFPYVTSESASVSIIFSKLIRCLSLSTQFSIADTLSLSLHHSSASCNIPTVTYNGRIYSH